MGSSQDLVGGDHDGATGMRPTLSQRALVVVVGNISHFTVDDPGTKLDGWPEVRTRGR